MTLLRAFRGASCLCALAFILAASRAASARGPRESVRIVVFGEPNASSVARLRAELESLGWQVFVQPRTRPAPGAPSADGVEPSPEELEREARAFDAMAIVDVDAQATLHVWTIDPAGHAEPVDVIHAPTDDVTALRSAEAVRAAIESRQSSPPPRSSSLLVRPVNAPQQVDTARAASLRAASSERTYPEFVLGAGAAVVFPGTGQITASGSFLLEGRYNFGPSWGIGSFVSVPVIKAHLDSEEVQPWLMGAGPMFTWALRSESSLHAGVGVAGGWLQYVRGGGAIYSDAFVLPYGRLAATLRLSSLLGLTFGTLGGVALPGPQFANSKSTITWGRPLIQASTTLDLFL